jgi:3-oxoadipate CoA-transferase alpha subunit
MIDKRVASLEEAVSGIADGATVLIGGFGDVGTPFELLSALLAQGARELEIVLNNAGGGQDAIVKLLEAGRVRKVTCSFPRSSLGNPVFDRLYAEGKLELELVPQGTLSERIRAGSAGIAGFYTPTSVGTRLAHGKEQREFDGRAYVLERPIVGDVALVKALKADRWGNLVYYGGARNFGPVMAACGRLTIVQVKELVELGALDPEHIVTPGIYVDRVVELGI